MSKFSEYATSTAFLVHLTKAQVKVMAAHVASERNKFVPAPDNVHTYRALDAKGLLRTDEKGDWWLTPAGKLLIPLLRAAELIK